MANVPVAVFATVLLTPLWRWVEARLSIEAIGHSGPSAWCFSLVFASSFFASIGMLVWVRRPADRQSTTHEA